MSEGKRLEKTFKILLNGAETSVSYATVFQLRDGLFNRRHIVILNGFQISEDAPLTENDELTVLKKGVMPSENEFEAMLRARNTPRIYEKLKSAKVGVAGLGGLGSNIAVALARLGVGALVLADFDVVEPSNLNRQHYFVPHLGMKKTDALKNQISDINRFISIETADVFLTEDNAAKIFSDCEIVCEAFDNPEAKAAVTTALLGAGKKVVAASGLAGYGSANDIKTEKRFGGLYVCGDNESGAEVGVGLMSPRILVCAGHQANMVLRLILGMEV